MNKTVEILITNQDYVDIIKFCELNQINEVVSVSVFSSNSLFITYNITYPPQITYSSLTYFTDLTKFEANLVLLNLEWS